MEACTSEQRQAEGFRVTGIGAEVRLAPHPKACTCITLTMIVSSLPALKMSSRGWRPSPLVHQTQIPNEKELKANVC